MTKGYNKDAKLDHRQWLRNIVEGPCFRYSILGIIFVNAITLGLETSPRVFEEVGPTLEVIDTIILWVFVGMHSTVVPSVSIVFAFFMKKYLIDPIDKIRMKRYNMLIRDQ